MEYNENLDDVIFHNDPLYMKSLIGKTVTVETKNYTKTGIVHVIDPIYKTLVLRIQTEEGKQFSIFPHHAIKSLEIISSEIQEEIIPKETLEDFSAKKEQLKRWLQKIFVMFEECGDHIKIGQHVTVVPPYNPQTSIICNSTVILENIQRVLSLMPDDI